MELNEMSLLKSITLTDNDALVVVDMQNDFMPGGALAVKEGDTIIEGVNRVMSTFFKKDLTVVLTQDWHPADHKSFASAYPGKKPFDPFEAPGIGPILWPDHCVQGMEGAHFHKDLDITLAHAIIRKGYYTDIDSYSGFLDNDKKSTTGLDGLLKSKKIRRIFTCGLALDYCVFFTATDGIDMGFEVIFMPDLTRAVGDPEDSVSNALETMVKKGIQFAQSSIII
jgi:nicotinamidase/pyrazinamidase